MYIYKVHMRGVNVFVPPEQHYMVHSAYYDAEPGTSPKEVAEYAFRLLNGFYGEYPEGYSYRSVSVGDIIEVASMVDDRLDVEYSYRVDEIGFTLIKNRAFA